MTDISRFENIKTLEEDVAHYLSENPVSDPDDWMTKRARIKELLFINLKSEGSKVEALAAAFHRLDRVLQKLRESTASFESKSGQQAAFEVPSSAIAKSALTALAQPIRLKRPPQNMDPPIEAAYLMDAMELPVASSPSGETSNSARPEFTPVPSMEPPIVPQNPFMDVETPAEPTIMETSLEPDPNLVMTSDQVVHTVNQSVPQKRIAETSIGDNPVFTALSKIRTVVSNKVFCGGLIGFMMALSLMIVLLQLGPANSVFGISSFQAIGVSQGADEDLFEQRRQFLKDAERALAAYVQVSKVHPLAEEFTAAKSVFQAIRSRGITLNLPADLSFETLRYRSDGRSYKLVFVGSGDCHRARVYWPEAIDTKRAFGPVDCLAYGVWTPNAAHW